MAGYKLMYHSTIEFESLDELKKYCFNNNLFYQEKIGVEIKGEIFNQAGAEVAVVCSAQSSSFKNIYPGTKWILCFT